MHAHEYLLRVLGIIFLHIFEVYVEADATSPTSNISVRMISNECNIGSAMPTDRLREGLLAALRKGNPPDVEIAPHDVEGDPLASLLTVAVALVNGRSPSEMLIGTAAKVLGEDDIDVALLRGALKVTVPPMLSAVWFHALTLERAKVIEESPTTWNPPEKPGS